MSRITAGPYWRASIDGFELDKGLNLRVMTFVVTLKTTAVPSLQFKLSNIGKTLLTHEYLQLGKKIVFSYGYPSFDWMAPTREFVISEIQADYPQDGVPTVEYLAVSHSIAMGKVKYSAVISGGQTLEEYLRFIADKYGYILDIQGGSPSIRTVYQTNESDIDMAKRVASSYGYEFILDDAQEIPVMRVYRDFDEGAPEKRWTYQGGPGLPNSGIIQFRPKVKKFRKASAVKCNAIDPSTKSPISGKSDDTTVERAIAGVASLMSQLYVANPEDGQAGVQSYPEGVFTDGDQDFAFQGPLTEDQAASSNPWGPSETAHETPGSGKEETKENTDATFRDNERGLASGSITMLGDPDIVASTLVELQGLDAPLNGLWLVTEVIHEIAPAPYLIKCEMAKKGLGKAGDLGCTPSDASLSVPNDDEFVGPEQEGGGPTETSTAQVVADPEAGGLSAEEEF